MHQEEEAEEEHLDQAEAEEEWYIKDHPEERIFKEVLLEAIQYASYD